MTRDATTTRRNVLKRTAALLAAGPYVITSAALGAGDKPAASERITMALIGCGGRGRSVMQGLVGKGAQVVASCDVYKDRREAIARQYQARSYLTSKGLNRRQKASTLKPIPLTISSSFLCYGHPPNTETTN